MDFAAEFRRCLDELDAAGVRRVWHHVSPHLDQPKSDSDALTCLHMARTASESIHIDKRAYSHAWLLDHGFPSQLPDRLKPAAQRLYPRVVSGVGISVNVRSPLLKPIVAPVRTAMENAVLDAYAENRTDPEFVKARIDEAKEKTLQQLLG